MSRSFLYVLQKGDYHHTRNTLVTSNVHLLAKTYASLLADPDYFSTYDRPAVEIWKDDQIIGSFCELEKVESKIKKAVTKIAMGMK